MEQLPSIQKVKDQARGDHSFHDGVQLNNGGHAMRKATDKKVGKPPDYIEVSVEIRARSNSYHRRSR